MESCCFHIGGKFCRGKAYRVKFAHHGTGTVERDQRNLNVHQLAARLINGKMATLHELQTVYSFKDMLYLDEVLNLQEEHNYLQNKKKDK